jgi:hypothetical protein
VLLHHSHSPVQIARFTTRISSRYFRSAHSMSFIDHLSGGLFEPLRREAQTEPSHRLGGSVAAAQPVL